MLLAFSLIFAGGVVLPQQPQPTYRVHGSVRDLQLVGIKEARVDFEAAGKRFSERTEPDGKFSLLLPSGTYSLTVTATGFCSHAEPTFIDGKEPNQAINVILLDCSDCSDTIIDFVEPRFEPDAPLPKPLDPKTLALIYKQENLATGKSEERPSTLLFGRRTDLAQFVEYTGLDCPGREQRVVLEYYGGSLTAAKLRFNKESHIIDGEGEVTVVDQRGVTRGSTVEIDLSSNRPVAVVHK